MWLACRLAFVAGCLSFAASTCGPAQEITVQENITEDTCWCGIVYLNTLVFVHPGATLELCPPTTVQAKITRTTDGQCLHRSDILEISRSAAGLIVLPGAKILAEGSPDAPITFTTQRDSLLDPLQGTWAGVMILGNAVVNRRPAYAEGLEGVAYGGGDDEDNSGKLRYARFWYGGGALLGEGNAFSGLFLGGVGRSTVVEYVEVAYSLNDGLKVAGGTVNLKYISAFNNCDNQIAVESGYRGSMQYVFVFISGSKWWGGNAGIEVASARDELTDPMSHVTINGPGRDACDVEHKPDHFFEALFAIRRGASCVLLNTMLLNAEMGLQVSPKDMSRVSHDTNSLSEDMNFIYISPGLCFGAVSTPFAWTGALQQNLCMLGIAGDGVCLDAPCGREIATSFNPRLRESANLKYDDVGLVNTVLSAGLDYAYHTGAFSSDSPTWLNLWSLHYRSATLSSECGDLKLPGDRNTHRTMESWATLAFVVAVVVLLIAGLWKVFEICFECCWWIVVLRIAVRRVEPGPSPPPRYRQEAWPLPSEVLGAPAELCMEEPEEIT